ncbi:palmitoyltransferase [Anaeramoeba ignava]|uniref:Palmitoyltransferase n=1 Tax=Anaeramoeba ignava TaxID=1746090 RepID=A0A9Q0LCW7_ANAIG|nr:palmitoyltransferase [Anaeramoeba ignava]
MEKPEICPICFQNYSQERKPMIICQKSHNICSHCVKTLNSCPFCKSSFNKFQPFPNSILLKFVEAIQKKPEEQIIPFIPLSELEVEPKPFAVGGSAQIFKAKWKEKDVVIKRMNTIYDQKEKQQIENEIKLSMNLSDPLIIKTYGKTEIDNMIGIVIEFAEQGDLLHKIPYLTFEEQIDYSLQIIEGIELLHSNLIIHRDLKPENILISNNQPKISDFGISKIREHTLQVTSAIISFGYSAPELFQKGSFYDTSCDIYSLSMILYEIFSKKQAFENHTPQMIIFKSMKGERPEFPQDFPKELSEVIKKGWSSNPKERCSLNEFTKCLNMMKSQNQRQPKKTNQQKTRHSTIFSKPNSRNQKGQSMNFNSTSFTQQFSHLEKIEQDFKQKFDVPDIKIPQFPDSQENIYSKLKGKVENLEKEKQEKQKLEQEKQEALQTLQPYFEKLKNSIEENDKDKTKELMEIDLSFIFQCMKNYPTNEFIQENCCLALRKFTDKEKVGISFNQGNLNGFSLMIKAMVNFPFNRFLQLQYFLVIINIGKTSVNKQQIEENFGIDTIISTMVNFTNKDTEIYNKGIETLGVLGLDRKEIQKLLKEKKKIVEKRDEKKLKPLKEEYRKSKPGRKETLFHYFSKKEPIDFEIFQILFKKRSEWNKQDKKFTMKKKELLNLFNPFHFFSG